MSCRAYAKRRGVSAMAVSGAIKEGRLRLSVVRDAFGQPKIADPDLADREWAAHTDYTDSPQLAAPAVAVAPAPDVGDVPPGETVATAAARAKHWEAKHRELKYREAAKELIPKREVVAAVVADYTACKTRLLAIPSRARQALPHLSHADMVVIEDLVREALEHLAGEKFE